MEGEKHPRNHRGESHRVFSGCYFLVLTGGFFHAHARPAVPANAVKGQRNVVRRPFLRQPSSETQRTAVIRMSTCPSSFLIFKKSTEGEDEKKKKKRSKPRKNEFALSRLLDVDRSGLKALPSRLLFSKGSPCNPRFVSLANSFEGRTTASLLFALDGKRRNAEKSSGYSVYEVIGRRVENYRRSSN